MPDEIKCAGPAWVRRLTWAIFGLHGILLLWMIPDYFPNIDHGYHAALAREYARHGTYFWDNINYAPEGRPNLQGPLLHYAIAAVGLLLGGSGDAFVTALAILAVLQWAAAMFTAWYFARRYGGDRAALVAVTLISGSAFAAVSFFLGLPSGWVFILTPWAIHFFLEGRTALAVLFTAASIYVHLGGVSTAPLGVLVAAVFTRSWRRLLLTGAATLLLALPYLIHFLRHLEWYRGQRGHVAFMVAPLVYLAGVPGLLLLLRRPGKHVFLIAWVVAPAAWIYQDAVRYLLQSTIAFSVLGGIFVTWLWQRIPRPAWRTAFITLVLLTATLFPLSIPSLAVELGWNLKLDLPRQLDWAEMRAVARVIERDRLNARVLAVYHSGLGDAIAVYTPVRVMFGHWVEVQPKVYSARELPAAAMAYILPVPPGDPLLRTLEQRGLVRLHGGGARTSVITLARRASLEEAAALAGDVLAEEAAWLAEHAVNNVLPPVTDLFSPEALRARRQRLNGQRSRMGRIEAAVLVYAHALEPADPARARGVRGAARGFGSIAAFLGDDSTTDFMNDARHEQLRRNLRRVAEEAKSLRTDKFPSPRLDQAVDKLFDEYFWAA